MASFIVKSDNTGSTVQRLTRRFLAGAYSLGQESYYKDGIHYAGSG